MNNVDASATLLASESTLIKSTSSPETSAFVVHRLRSNGDVQQNKELISDGISRKPPISISVSLPPPPLSDISSNQKVSYRPNSITSSEGAVTIDDVDDDITTTGSDSYGHDYSSSNEGKPHRFFSENLLRIYSSL